MYWEHLFLTEKHRVDYIASKLQDGVDDWYISIHNAQGPELCEVDEFMWALWVQYEDPMEREKARNYLRALKQGLKMVCKYTEDFKRHTAKVQGAPATSTSEVKEKRLDNPLRKSMAKPKFQCGLQVNILEGSPESSSEDDEEPAGKGQDLL
ncbi:UNVERIFIED_CONTAM: hypothetical protein K2H54_006425 [Gekko kuhli]